MQRAGLAALLVLTLCLYLQLQPAQCKASHHSKWWKKRGAKRVAHMMGMDEASANVTANKVLVVSNPPLPPKPDPNKPILPGRNGTTEFRPSHSIPRILHQVFLSGMSEFENLAARNDTKFSTHYRESCMSQHADWEYKFWDLAAAEALLEEQYAWFLPTFRSLPRTVLKGDAVRAFILHAYGGVYLDMDVECFKSTEQMLGDYDLVLQCEYRTLRDINNAVLASVPGHPFWVQVMKTIMVTTQSLGDLDNPQTILHSTGPGITLQAFHAIVPSAKGAGNYVGEWLSSDGSKIRVYGVMEWYVPCEWDQHECHKQIQQQREAGQLPESLAGHHHYSGSWLKETKVGSRRKRA